MYLLKPAAECNCAAIIRFMHSMPVEQLHGTCGAENFMNGDGFDISEYLIRCDNAMSGDSPSYQYFLESDEDYIVASVNIRPKNSPTRGGAIGASVRPACRGMHLAPSVLYAVAPRLDNPTVTIAHDNFPSLQSVAHIRGVLRGILSGDLVFDISDPQDFPGRREIVIFNWLG